jgi:hypothetical protein
MLARERLASSPVWLRTGRTERGGGAHSFVSRTPVKLFSGDFYLGGGNSIGRTYDVTPDGRRF